MEENSGRVQPAAAFRKRQRGGPLTDRLDEEKLEMLRTWGEGLLNDGRDELRAAGRAILMLVEEIELLNVDLWHVRETAVSEAQQPPPETQESRSHLGSALQRRIGGLRRRRAPDSPER